MAKIGKCVACQRSEVRIKAKERCSTCYETFRHTMTTDDKAWKRTQYPSDADMVRLMQVCGSWNKVAEAIGVSRGSLRDYVDRRAELKTSMSAHLKPALTGEQRIENIRKAGREYQQRWRAANPELAREQRRVQMNSYEPDYRKKWNSYNRAKRKNATMTMTKEDRELSLEYKKLTSLDPCVYCGAPQEHDDHIQPVSKGGTDHWYNIAPACADCNLRKTDKLLLHFLLDRVVSHD